MTTVTTSHINEKHNQESTNPMLLSAYNFVVDYLGRDGDLTSSDKANMHDTAVRAAKAFADLVSTRTEIRAALAEVLKTGFPREAEDGFEAGIITQGPIQFTSLCPHHLLPVFYDAYVGYLPGVEEGSVLLGLSKLARIAIILGKRPVLQEQLASDIANVLFQRDGNDFGFPAIKTRGSAVLLIGKHSCMCVRGVMSNALTQVCEVRGIFKEPSYESRFYQAVESIKRHS